MFLNTRTNNGRDQANQMMQPSFMPQQQLQQPQPRQVQQYQTQFVAQTPQASQMRQVQQQAPLPPLQRPQFLVQQQQPQQQQQAPRLVVNPFDLLGISRATTDENVIHDAYRRLAWVLHPDKGGDPKKFQDVTRAYKIILEAVQQSKNESFDMLKRQAEADIAGSAITGGYGNGRQDGQANPALAPLGNGKQFDQTTFNQVFSQHKMWSPHDDGYGDMMVTSATVVGDYRDMSAQAGRMTPEELLIMRERAITGVPIAQGSDQLLLFKADDKQFNQAFNDTFNQHVSNLFCSADLKPNDGSALKRCDLLI